MNFNELLIEYERVTFNNYLKTRKKFLKNLKNLKVNELNDNKLLNFIGDVKQIIDPLKQSLEGMKYFLKNQKVNFEKNDSIADDAELMEILILYNFFLRRRTSGSGSGSDSELSELSELPELESFSESESE